MVLPFIAQWLCLLWQRECRYFRQLTVGGWYLLTSFVVVERKAQGCRYIVCVYGFGSRRNGSKNFYANSFSFPRMKYIEWIIDIKERNGSMRSNGVSEHSLFGWVWVCVCRAFLLALFMVQFLVSARYRLTAVHRRLRTFVRVNLSIHGNCCATINHFEVRQRLNPLISLNLFQI